MSASSVMSSAQNRCRPQPLTWSEHQAIEVGTSWRSATTTFWASDSARGLGGGVRRHSPKNSPAQAGPLII